MRSPKCFVSSFIIISVHTVVPPPGFCGLTTVISEKAAVAVITTAVTVLIKIFLMCIYRSPILMRYTKSILTLLKNIPQIAAIIASAINVAGNGASSSSSHP